MTLNNLAILFYRGGMVTFGDVELIAGGLSLGISTKHDTGYTIALKLYSNFLNHVMFIDANPNVSNTSY